VTLTDAGPLVALVDAGQPDHARCRRALVTLRGPMVTTWPVFAEALSLLGAAGGWMAQTALWRLVNRGDLLVEVPRAMDRIAALMARHRNVSMDLAGASLVALAEERGLTLVFTLDPDFRAYRLARGRMFTVVPK